MKVKIEPSWESFLQNEFDAPYFKALADFVRAEYQSTVCYPPASLIFNAFNSCPLDRVKVVILGQDPYHNPGEAMGLSFSVPEGTKIPPSLVNIYKEIAADTGAAIPTSGNLTRWAEQGVLLLNATLTVRHGMAGSHCRHGWETFTDAVIKTISERRDHIVFMLWGNYAKCKRAMIDETRHLVLTTSHPSPLSVRHGFSGCRHFSKANQYLANNQQTPILW